MYETMTHYNISVTSAYESLTLNYEQKMLQAESSILADNANGMDIWLGLLKKCALEIFATANHVQIGLWKSQYRFIFATANHVQVRRLFSYCAYASWSSSGFRHWALISNKSHICGRLLVWVNMSNTRSIHPVIVVSPVASFTYKISDFRYWVFERKMCSVRDLLY